MNKSLIPLLILLVFLFINLKVQSEINAPLNKIDSLVLALSIAKEDTTKATIYLTLANEFRSSNPDTAIYFANKSLAIAKAIPDKMRIADGLLCKGRALIYLGKHDESLKCIDDAISIYNQLNALSRKDNKDTSVSISMKQKAQALHSLGFLYESTGNYTISLKHYFESLKIRQKSTENLGIADSYHAIGGVYMELGNYSESLKYLLLSLKTREESGDKKGVASSYNSIGNVYHYQGNEPQAFKYHLASLRIRKEIGDKNGMANSFNNMGNHYANQGDYTQALINLNASLKIMEETGNKNGISNALISIGNVFTQKNNYPEATKNFLSAIKIKEETGDKIGLAIGYLNLGNINRTIKRYSVSKKYLETALSYFLPTGNKLWLMTTYMEMSLLDSTIGNFILAYKDYKIHILYRDSLNDEEAKRKTLVTSMNYEFEKQQDSTKAEYEKKEALAKTEIKRQKLIKNSTIGGVSIVGGFSFLLIWSFNRRRKTSFEKQVSEVEMKALRSQMNPHFIFNSLQSVKKYIMENAKNDAAEYLSKFSTLMRMILENSRKQEVTLEKDLEALELYMELEALRFQNRFQFAIEVDPEIDREDTLIAPLLLQPFVENSIIHGISSKENGMIKVKVSKVDNMIKCTIEDNGIGRDQSVQIETGEKKKRESLGMKITQERLSIINRLKKVKTAINIFDLKDESNNPGGLRIELMLPFERAF